MAAPLARPPTTETAPAEDGGGHRPSRPPPPARARRPDATALPHAAALDATPVLAVAVVLVAAATGAVVLTQPWASGRDTPRADAPASHRRASLFTGQTYTFTRVRDAAALSAPVTRTVPAGCTVVFSGYCLGDTVTDETSQTPDVRWFILAGGGVMSSAVVHGNPPANLGPSPCPGSIAPPGTIHLNVHRTGTELRLQATGKA